jgi:hypothetical protein
MVRYFAMGREVTKEEADKVLEEYELNKKSIFYMNLFYFINV